MEDQNKRMKDLVKKMDENHEIYKEVEYEVLEESVLKNYKERFQKNMTVHNENNVYSNQGAGSTVNTMFNNDNNYISKSDYSNTPSKPFSNPNLTPKEALDIAIKRTLSSGSPVNGISFYDEINWNLDRLGFSSKNPIDIKAAINDLISFGEIK